MTRYGVMVPGATEAGPQVEVVAPFDRKAIGSVATTGAATVEHALQIAHGLFRRREAWLPAARRIEILESAAARVKQRAEALALEAAREGGKPLADSRVEVARAADTLRVCAEQLRTQPGAVIPMNLGASSANRLAFTLHEPIGVVLAISAFNHPLNLIAHQVGPAVASGCPVLIKPARATPLSCYRLVEILRECGLPEEWCMPIMPADNALTAHIAADPRIAFLSFIGSAKVGWALRAQLAPGTRCALEHGGAAPVIVAADADLDEAVPLLVKGGFYHSGQVCVSVQRIYVDEAIAGELAQRVAAAATKLKVGDPTLADTEAGPLITPDEVQRVDEWIAEALQRGARLLCGGRRISQTCYAPTVLLDPPDDVRVSTQEVFGPLVCIYRYKNMDEALARANALEVAFQAAVFTRNLDTALHCARRLDASAVMVNDHTAFRVDWMPFAGLKHSGLGTGGVPYSMHEMQVQKMIVLRSKMVRP